MVKATTIYKGKVIAEEEFELSPKWKGKQRKLEDYSEKGEDGERRRSKRSMQM